MFVVIGALWGLVGYVYSDKNLARAAIWGVSVAAVGWLIVLAALLIKYLRLMSRRRRSNQDEAEG